MRLNLGCCDAILPGYVNVDVVDGPGVDLVADLSKPWPWLDGTIERVRAHDVIEHLPDKIHTMNELWRVLEPGGIAEVAVPTTDGTGAFQDPTHVCYSEDTEVLTASGFTPLTRLRRGICVLTVDPDTMVAESVRCKDVVDLPYEGEMFHFETKRLDLLVTPDHNLWAAYPSSRGAMRWHWKRAEETRHLTGHHTLAMRSDMVWQGKDPGRFQFSAPHLGRDRSSSLSLSSRDFAEFMGWWLSEGWTHTEEGQHVYGGKRHWAYTVGIAQSATANPDKCEIIHAMLSRIGVPFGRSGASFVLQHKGLCSYLKRLGHAHEKYIPREVKQLPPDLLRVLLDSYALGDGRKVGSTSGRQLATVSPRLAADLQEVAIKAGYRSVVFGERREGKEYCILGRTTTNCRDIYFAGLYPSKLVWAPPPKVVPYQGRVLCPVLPRHHLVLVRRNGRAVWSGNSFWNRRSFLYYEAGNIYRDRFARSYGVRAAFRVVWEHTTQTMDGPRLEIHLQAVKS
mgnify:CR=1 FL=1